MTAFLEILFKSIPFPFGPECMMSTSGYHERNDRTGKCGWCSKDM